MRTGKTEGWTNINLTPESLIWCASSGGVYAGFAREGRIPAAKSPYSAMGHARELGLETMSEMANES